MSSTVYPDVFDSCGGFPYTVLQAADIRYVSASVASKPLAEALAVRPDPIRLLRTDGPTSYDDVDPEAYLDPSLRTVRPWYACFHLLVDGGVRLLQDRDVPFGDRAAMLTWVLWNLVERVETEGVPGVERLFRAAGDPNVRVEELARASSPLPVEIVSLGLTAKVLLDATELDHAFADQAVRALESLKRACTVDASDSADSRIDRISAQSPISGACAIACEQLAVMGYLNVLSLAQRNSPRRLAALFARWCAAMRTGLLLESVPGDIGSFVDAVVRTQRAIECNNSAGSLFAWLRSCRLYGAKPLMALARG